MESFDYIVVGAGSAGCVLANRLSADPSVRVLVVEAGGKDRSPNIKIPAAFAKQFHTKLDWDFATEPEPHVDGRSLYIPRGKCIGGSSSMNAMLYVRGRPLDYDGWEAQGAPGWGYRDVLPYFIKAEDNARGASEWHGASGPMKVADQRSPRPLDRRIIDGFVAAGIPWTADYNGPEQDGVSMFQVTQHNGRRFSAADAYLKPAAGRANLTIRPNTTVLGIELATGNRATGNRATGNQATGIRVKHGRNGSEVIRAEREVILSAGSIGSPQLLQLSGIGAPDDLNKVGIETRHALPGVGGNLQDHPFITVIWDVTDENTLAVAEKPRFLAEWVLRRSGPLSSTVAEVNAFVRSRPGLAAADLQYHMGPAYYDDHGAATYDGHAMVIAPVLVSPRARGRVWLRSANPTDKPRILTNSLSEPEDRASLVAGVKLARQVAEQAPLKEIITRELTPGPQATDDGDIEADIRRRLMLIYHPVGTCRMSDTADEAVVDSQLRVHGIDALRVIDASIMPVITGGNTHAPTIMIAERAADLILGKTPSNNDQILVS